MVSVGVGRPIAYPGPIKMRHKETGGQRTQIFGRLAFMKTSDLSKILHSDPEILGGTPVFFGTRVPVKSLFDHLEAGESIDDFIEGFPSVRREQVIALLERSRQELLRTG
jgi:uncharacterized protein (DUF433 family)